MFKFWTFCVFEPPFGGLGTTYDVHLGLIGKRVVDFLLVVIIELFSLGVTAEALRAKIKSTISLQRGQFDPQISGRRGRSPPFLDPGPFFNPEIPGLWETKSRDFGIRK